MNLCIFLLADQAEIQDLRDCLLLEQEEKNGLHKKLQDLEKECALSFHLDETTLLVRTPVPCSIYLSWYLFSCSADEQDKARSRAKKLDFKPAGGSTEAEDHEVEEGK